MHQDNPILIDCGLQYERGEPIELNENLPFPFEPSSINLLVLTHAHIDHSGNISTLIKQGYRTRYHVPKPMVVLVENLLNDSVNVQLAESGAKRRKGGSNHKSNTKVLYGQKDVSKTIDRLITLGFAKNSRLMRR